MSCRKSTTASLSILTAYRLVNAFGYWQAQNINNASATYLDDLQQAFGHIQSVAGSTTAIELWNGETGWPTDGKTVQGKSTPVCRMLSLTSGGSNYGAATAGTANAQDFFTNGVCAALDWNINVFYFEAFNEPWKPDSTGLDGQPGDEKHWGAYDAGRSPVVKDLSCNYNS